MRQTNTCKYALAISLLLGAPGFAASAESDGEWLVAPYFWGPDITLDNKTTGGGADIGISDLLDKTDGAGMVRVEYRRRQWGVLVDYIFMALSDQRTVMPPPTAPNVFVQANLDLDIWELGAFYRQSGDARSGFDWLFGFRRIIQEQLLLLTPDVNNPVTRRIDSREKYTDAFIGARFLYPLGEQFDLSARVDVSAGDTEGTSNILASVGYRFPSRYQIALHLGYRHTVLQLRDSSGTEVIDTEITLSGPFLGLLFRF